MQAPTQSQYTDTASVRDTLTALRQFAMSAGGDFAVAIPRLRSDLEEGLIAKGMHRSFAEDHAVAMADQLFMVRDALGDLGLATDRALSELDNIVTAAKIAEATQQKTEAVA